MRPVYQALLGIVLLASLSTTGIGAENKHGVGFGTNFANVDSDVFFDDEDHDGFSIYGKIGITDKWGIFIVYRDMEDDEDFSGGFEQTYEQIGVRALRMWRPDMRVRPHVAFGVTQTDFDATGVGFSASDDGIGISVSGGLEAGSQRIAFFSEYSITVVDLSGLAQPIGDDDTTITDLVLGIMFKF